MEVSFTCDGVLITLSEVIAIGENHKILDISCGGKTVQITDVESFRYCVHRLQQYLDAVEEE